MYVANTCKRYATHAIIVFKYCSSLVCEELKNITSTYKN